MALPSMVQSIVNVRDRGEGQNVAALAHGAVIGRRLYKLGVRWGGAAASRNTPPIAAANNPLRYDQSVVEAGIWVGLYYHPEQEA